MICFNFTLPVVASDLNREEQIIASIDSSLKKITFLNNKINKTETILSYSKWSYFNGLAFSRETETIYFAALRDDEYKFAIYSLNINSLNKEPEKLISNGWRPALSLDSSKMAFLRNPNQLWIHNIKSKNSKKALNDIYSRSQCVWIANDKLLYHNLSDELIIFNVSKNEKKQTGHSYVVPGALSPDQNKVLCGSYYGNDIFLFYPSTNELKSIKKNKYLGFGSIFTWLNDGSGFLYTMQTWMNVLTLNETRDLFLHKFSGKDAHLLNTPGFSGGVSISLK